MRREVEGPQVKPQTFEETMALSKERADLKTQAESEQDLAGGYVVVEDILPNHVEKHLNLMYRRGWKLAGIYRGHGGENLIFYKAAL